MLLSVVQVQLKQLLLVVELISLNVAEDILPDADGTRNLGSTSKRFAELFLTGNTINLGGATISSDGTGTIVISGDGVTLNSTTQELQQVKNLLCCK